ncbi:hypothetical protein INT45_001101 [Circinella minor]|uniref:Uncharacterized protein n=1 Tax=Circinella minor TaxID=1195481 RepID=A0A8H7RID4_9FUNG|nr:hypothetical protein INT45_001101 [Circinella minor]
MFDCPFCGTNLKGTSLDRHLQSFCFVADSDSTEETNSAESEHIEHIEQDYTHDTSLTVERSIDHPGGDLSTHDHIDPPMPNDILHSGDTHIINITDNEEYEVDYDYSDNNSNYSSDVDDDSENNDNYFVLDTYFSSDDDDELSVDNENTARSTSMENGIMVLDFRDLPLPPDKRNI